MDEQGEQTTDFSFFPSFFLSFFFFLDQELGGVAFASFCSIKRSPPGQPRLGLLHFCVSRDRWTAYLRPNLNPVIPNISGECFPPRVLFQGRSLFEPCSSTPAAARALRHVVSGSLERRRLSQGKRGQLFVWPQSPAL